MSKRKKFWITFGIVCACIAMLLVIFSFVFRLKTVDVEIRQRAEQSQTKLPDGVQEKVLDFGDFKYGSHIMFYNTDDNIAKIEKNIPYIKVEQVIKHFPNIIRVYISERTMKYRVQDELNARKWYILDEDFKVLETVTTEEANDQTGEYYQKTIEISPETLKISADLGDFVQNDSMKNFLNSIASGIYGRTKDIAKAKLVSISNESGEIVTKIFIKHNNVVINIKGEEHITEKVFKGVSLIYDVNAEEIGGITEGQVINVYKDTNGQIVAI